MKSARVLVLGSGAGEHAMEIAGAAQSIASDLGGEACGAIIGADCHLAAGAMARSGVARVIIGERGELAPYCCDRYVAAAHAAVAEVEPSLVLIPHDERSAEWAPMLAARLHAGIATNCVGLRVEAGKILLRRPVCGGAAEAEYEANRAIAIATVQPRIFAPRSADGMAPIQRIEIPTIEPRMQVIEEIPDAGDAGRPLKGARVVVAGGLGVGGVEHWRLVEDAASALDGAVGATRAAVELGWAPVSRQVGFSGQKVAPELYLAIGISGAQHHLAGIAAARTIVAINSDSNAPIFARARFGVVGDAKKVLPAFSERIRELSAGRGAD